jgi:transposase, IS6 family
MLLLDSSVCGLFKWRQFEPEVILLAVGWYLRFSLSYRDVDEMYIRVKGKWRYLYRAVDSSGATLDFLLSAKQDAAAAKRFLAKALGGANHPAPRVINTDGHTAYPPAVAQLKVEGALAEDSNIDRCSILTMYWNRIIER